MSFLVICSAALMFTLVLAVLDAPLSALKAKERRVRAVTESGQPIFNEFEGNLFDRMFGPLIKRIRQAQFNSKAKRASRGNKQSASQEKLEKKLRAAGLYIEPSTFTAIQLVLIVLLVIGALIATANLEAQAEIKLLILVGAAVLGLALPILAIRAISRSRQDSMKKQLPDMMDVLSVSIDAGLGFDAALKRALDKFTGALKEELTVASMEISMGKPRRDALSDMAERCDIAELKILIAAIVQSEQMGTPIKNVLKTQSAQLRATRKQIAQEKGMKAPVKMMLPMVVFIFPVLLIILMGPTVMNIIDVFGK
ncbi:MAG TPA: type II secretion system F family protein [Clostridia bacterium]|nr:type II secretion system F family protein [Clostridia bacterium]